MNNTRQKWSGYIMWLSVALSIVLLGWMVVPGTIIEWQPTGPDGTGVYAYRNYMLSLLHAPTIAFVLAGVALFISALGNWGLLFPGKFRLITLILGILVFAMCWRTYQNYQDIPSDLAIWPPVISLCQTVVSGIAFLVAPREDPGQEDEEE